MPETPQEPRHKFSALTTLAAVLATFLLAAAAYVCWQAAHILFPQNVYETALPITISDTIEADGVLLFDEPLSNLDAKLRVSMRTEIRRIQQEVGITAIYVTHDQSEAMALSDNIIIMKNGVVEQMGSPQEIYYHPVNEFVADFIGEANFLKGVMSGHNGTHALLTIEGHEMPIAGRDDLKEGETYTVVLRPESGHLADQGGLPCKVIVSCFMGSYQNYHVMVGDTLVKLAEHNPKNKRIYQVGEACQLVFDPEEVHVL